MTNKEILLKESEKGIIIRNVSTKEEKEVQQLNQFYGLDQAKTMVRIIGQPLFKDLDYSTLNLIVDFVQRLIQPNITLNRNETEEQKNKASAEIKPVLHKIKAARGCCAKVKESRRSSYSNSKLLNPRRRKNNFS